MRLEEQLVLPKYKAVEHWAKLEIGKVDPELLSQRMQKYPIAEFNAARARLDPKNILSNSIVDRVFPRDDIKT